MEGISRSTFNANGVAETYCKGIRSQTFRLRLLFWNLINNPSVSNTRKRYPQLQVTQLGGGDFAFTYLGIFSSFSPVWPYSALVKAASRGNKFRASGAYGNEIFKKKKVQNKHFTQSVASVESVSRGGGGRNVDPSLQPFWTTQPMPMGNCKNCVPPTYLAQNDDESPPKRQWDKEEDCSFIFPEEKMYVVQGNQLHHCIPGCLCCHPQPS